MVLVIPVIICMLTLTKMLLDMLCLSILTICIYTGQDIIVFVFISLVAGKYEGKTDLLTPASDAA